MRVGGVDFGALRRHFDALLEQPLSRQQSLLAELEAAAPELAAQLRRLLQQAATTPGAADRQLRQGEQLGPYAIEAVIGAGGMGVVYRARRADGAYQQSVALKVIAPGLETTPLKQRFLRERQILARLDHPHIARLLDGGVSVSGQLWLALELVDGLPLTEWVQTRRPGLRQRIELFLDLCAAVSHAHDQLVLHRDLKPANVLVDTQGRLKLLDFGIAGLLDDTAQPVATRALAMTVRYAAPEQVRQQRCTLGTDVYALGVLLFELLSEQSPYPDAAAGRQSWADAALRAEPASLRQATRHDHYSASERRALGGELELIVRHALAKSVDERYPAVAVLAADLRDWLAGRPARSGIGGAAAQVRALLRRYRWPLVAAAAVLLALGSVSFWALSEARQARLQASAAQANFQALLSVLTSASPSDYVGREATASEFLVAAARQIDQQLKMQPQAVWRALSEIGNGLLNLGREEAAEQVLQLATAAMARDPLVTVEAELGVLKLLCFAQSRTAAASRGAATAARIAHLATQPGAAAETAGDALATAAGMLARHGQVELSAQLLSRLDALVTAGAPLAPAIGEKIARQRGLGLLRNAQPNLAVASFASALQLIESHPGQFSVLRRAELQAFLADAQQASGAFERASETLLAAQSVFAKEYPETHPERAGFDLVTAEIALGQGQIERAAALASTVLPRLAQPEARPRGYRLLASLALRQGDCPAAASALGQIEPGLALDLRSRQSLARLQSEFAQRCAR